MASTSPGYCRNGTYPLNNVYGGGETVLCVRVCVCVWYGGEEGVCVMLYMCSVVCVCDVDCVWGGMVYIHMLVPKLSQIKGSFGSNVNATSH